MPGPDRLNEIIQSWKLQEALPRESPEGLDDVVWLVGEVERLRSAYDSALERIGYAEEFRDYWKLKFESLESQLQKGGCLKSMAGEDETCITDLCGLCSLRKENEELRQKLQAEKPET